MRTCGTCGFPLKFARFFDWRSDGTIVGTDRVRMQSQITFLECGETEGLFFDLSMMLGISIDHILIEAEKNVGKAFYASTPLHLLRYAPRNRYVRPQWIAKAFMRAVRNDVAGLGSGIISADSYRGGRSMVIRFANTCFFPRQVGTSLGIYESIEGIEGADFEYGVEDGDLVIWMRHPTIPSEPLSETRLRLDAVRPGDGPLSYERCSSCGTPLPASRTLEFDITRGVITNRLTAKRESIGAVQSVNAMLRELEAELGEDVGDMLFACQKEITRQRLERDERNYRGEFWESCLLDFALRGLGYPSSVERGEDSITVETRNAYNQVLYAARMAAAFEHSTGRDSEITWAVRRPDCGVYTISAPKPPRRRKARS